MYVVYMSLLLGVVMFVCVLYMSLLLCVSVSMCLNIISLYRVCVDIVRGVCGMVSCGSGITGEGFGVGSFIGSSLGLLLGLESGFGVGISLGCVDIRMYVVCHCYHV